MNTYSLIRSESDPKVIGIKTGLSQVELKQEQESYRLLDEFLDIFTFWDKKDFALPDSIQLSVQHGKLLKGAKLTDFMRFRPYLIDCHFIIRENIRLLLEEFILPEHYFIPVEILNRDHMTERHYLFYMPDLHFEVIDFSKSIFYTGGIATEKKKYKSQIGKSTGCC